MPDTCPFCNPDPDQVFHESDLVIGLWDRYPVSPGHALLVPRRHVADWFDATPEEQQALTAALRIIPPLRFPNQSSCCEDLKCQIRISNSSDTPLIKHVGIHEPLRGPECEQATA